MIWAVVIIGLPIISILAFGAFNISSGIYLKSLCRVDDIERDEIAVTFDDGVDMQITPKVLDMLDSYGAKATFFIIGEKAEKHPTLVQEIARRGHSIGNHSYYHRASFPMQRSENIYSEIVKCNEVLGQILGKQPTLFRPPFGVTNPMVASAVRQSGLTSIGWSIRSLDTLGQPVEKVAGRVASRISKGEVILLHDNREGADILLGKILQEITHKGLRCVTINELFKI
ncbi:MAG: polysaccharide deacetylase family protein [Rikenellaceae bacterium]